MSARTPRRRALAIALFLAALGAGPIVNAQNSLPPHDLIRVPQSVPSHVTPPHGSTIARSRLVEIDFGPMGRRRATKDVTTPVQARLRLDLFDGARYHATLRKVHGSDAAGQVFEGDIDGSAGSSVVFAVKDGQIFGNIRSGERWYQIRYAGEGLHAVLEMDESTMPPLLEPMAADAIAQPALTEATANDDGSVIDVLVMYTPSVKAAAGGTTGIANLINTAIAETNTAYQNSGVTQRLRLVHSAETTDWLYNGAPVNADDYSFSNALSLLRQNGDGVMDAAHTLRDAYGADAVALMIDRSEACGVAYVMRTVSNSFQSSAFSVTSWQCATGYYSFGHELGHNMGLAHDRANESSAGAFSYAYGWQNPNGAFRTVMAYDCSGGCPRVPYFSNPTVTYNGFATGSPIGTPTEAHNAQALNNTAMTFSNFRQSATPVCSYALSSSSAAIGVAGGTQTVTVTTQSGCTWSAESLSSFVIVSPQNGSGSGVVSYTVAANTGASRAGTATIAGQTFTVMQAGPPPTNVNARALTPSAVLVMWDAFLDATSYEIYRRSANGAYQFLASAPAATFTDISVSAGTAYQYRVRAQTPAGFSDYSTGDVAIAMTFTDDPIVARTTAIRAVHLSELRTAVNALRTLAGLGAMSFIDAIPSGATMKVVHVTELRAALTDARTALFLPAVGYTAGAALSSPVLAVHFQEIRDRLK